MECSIKAEKIQAMINYKRAHILYNFILYTLSSLVTFFFFSYQFSFPSIKCLLFSLPNINIDFFSLDAKCLFIVANIIIIFILIEESKVVRSPNSSPASDIYDEYIARSRRSTYPYKRIPYVVAKEEGDNGFVKSMNLEENKHGNIKYLYDEEKRKEMRVSNSTMNHKQKKKEELNKRVEAKGGKEGQHYMPKEELNKKVEAFIARVKKQRLLEAKLVDHSKG